MLCDILNVFPNTYAITKQMGESVLLKEGRNLPIAIFRPAMVTPAWKEPVPVRSDDLLGLTVVK